MTKEVLKFAGQEVVIDSENLRFSEATLNEYIQRESAYYDNFGAYLALAEKNLQNKEVLHEKLYSDRFVEAKESGSTEKLAEAKAKADQDVVSIKEDVIEAKYIVNRLKQHLRAWDKNHDNAQSLGHMLRKTMDKLNAEIFAKTYQTETPAGRIVSESITPCEDVKERGSGFETELSIENLY